ncbi:hypothetical protein ACFLSX_01535 [Calditrichota bacterium]
MEVPHKILSLIDRFKKIEHKEFQSSAVKTKYIEPFFQTLGWEIDNKRKSIAPFKEVIILTKITANSPDFLFIANDKCKFYVSIPEEQIELDNESNIVRKLQQFCWNANIPIGVVTNFKNLNIYDFRMKPGSKIKSILSLDYHQYDSNWRQ